MIVQLCGMHGVMYIFQENIKAIEAYNYLLNEPEGTIPLRVSALLTLGQLYLVKKITIKV